MGLDHSLVGVPSEPHLRSWDSKDALLYAVGVGAGLGDPLLAAARTLAGRPTHPRLTRPLSVSRIFLENHSSNRTRLRRRR